MASDDAQQQNDTAREPQTYNQIAAAHIDTLNEVNRQLPKVLTYFATALTQLTNNPIRTGDQENEEDSKAARQSAFRKYALFVGVLVAQVRDELTNSINDLEKLKVIPKSQPKFTTFSTEASKEEGNSGQKNVPPKDPESSVTNGGFGEFDIGVLNARASSGQIGEEDVLDRVKGILEELTKRTQGSHGGEEMVTDE